MSSKPIEDYALIADTWASACHLSGARASDSQDLCR